MYFLPLIAACLLVCGFSGISCPEETGIVESLNFQPLTPPTNLMIPGAVLAIEEEIINGERQQKLHMSCGPRAALGERAQLMQSSTVSQAMHNKTKSMWNLDAKALSAITANIDSQHIKSITVTMTNAKVISLSDADVLSNLPYRSEACKAAIRQRLANNYMMTMISSALVADMVWSVDWNEATTAKMSATDRVMELQKISSNLGGGHSRIGQRKIESKQIALGIRTDAFLLALTVPEMESWTDRVAEQAATERGTIHEPVRADVSAPDAPYVLPAGNTYSLPELSLEDF